VAELSREYEENERKLNEVESKINDIGIDNIKYFKKSWKHLDSLGRENLLWSMISNIVVKDSGQLCFKRVCMVTNHHLIPTTSHPYINEVIF
jgi:hypothetical protein